MRSLQAADLPGTIAVFPLAGALLLPRARLPLHIFEPRYLAMLDDVLKTPHRLIGMVQPREEAPVPRLHAVGCAGRVTGFSETGDGRYMVQLTGVCRFRLGEEVAGFTPWRRWSADWAPFARDLAGGETDEGFDREAFLDLLGRFFAAMELTADWSNLREAEPEMLVNSLSMLLPFAVEDRQALLEAPTLAARRETMMTLMDFALRAGPGEERVQ